MAKAKGFKSEQKFAAAPSVVNGTKSPVEAAQLLSCHPKMIALWKKEVEAHGASIFERESDSEEKNKKDCQARTLDRPPHDREQFFRACVRQVGWSVKEKRALIKKHRGKDKPLSLFQKAIGLSPKCWIEKANDDSQKQEYASGNDRLV
jgi:hypothetical protein